MFLIFSNYFIVGVMTERVSPKKVGRFDRTKAWRFCDTRITAGYKDID